MGQEPDDSVAPGGDQGQEPDEHADEGLDPEIRKLRAEAKRLRLERNEARDRAKQYEDRDKTDGQRRAEELATATARAERAETRLLKYEVAAELGISQHAGRLHGDTREELVADAKALTKEFGLSSDGQRADFSSGVRRPVQRAKTMNDIIRQAAGR